MQIQVLFILGRELVKKMLHFGKSETHSETRLFII